MSDPILTCEQVHLLLSQGEPGGERHLRRCRSCRHEAERLDAMFRVFRTQPGVEVPTRLDQSIRGMLTGPSPVTESRMHLPIALSLAIAATLALITGLMGILLNWYPASQAIARGLVLAVVYVATTSVATLPLLFRGRHSRLEVRQWT